MLFHEPMPNSSLNLTDKVEAALLSEVSEIADQVCNRMLVSGAAVLLKNRDGFRDPDNVVCLYRSCFSLDHELFFAKPARLGD